MFMCEECDKLMKELREEICSLKASRSFYEARSAALTGENEFLQKTIDGLICVLKGEPEP